MQRTYVARYAHVLPRLMSLPTAASLWHEVLTSSRDCFASTGEVADSASTPKQSASANVRILNLLVVTKHTVRLVSKPHTLGINEVRWQLRRWPRAETKGSHCCSSFKAPQSFPVTIGPGSLPSLALSHYNLFSKEA